MNPIRRLRLDPFLMMILLMMLAATIAPAHGIGKPFFKHLTTVAGAKLSREAILAGVGHWRLHSLKLATTFILFLPAAVSILVLPLMLFHQIQLMVCAVLAQRYARRS